MARNITKFNQLIQQWLSTFATTYRGLLPSGETPTSPYITYTPYVSNFATQFIQPISIYQENASSYTGVLDVVDNIDGAVGEGGIVIGDNDMRIAIYKGNPFYQDKPEENENIKAGYVNLLMTIYAKVR